MSLLNRKRISRLQLGTIMAVAVAGLTSLSSQSAQAANAEKLSGSGPNLILNTDAGWQAVGGGAIVSPTSGDLAIFNNNATGNAAANTFVLGGTDASWLGIQLVNPASAITLNHTANQITLGTSGLDMSAATQNLVSNGRITLGASQSWNVAAGRSVTLAGNTGILNTGSGLIWTVNGAGIVTVGTAVNSGGDSISADNLSGNATIIKSGSGTLGFMSTRINNFTGSLTVNDGVVMILNGRSFAPAASATSHFLAPTITMNGGTLSLTKNNVYPNPIIINDTSNVFFNLPAALTLEGRLSGAGTISMMTANDQRVGIGMSESNTQNQFTGFTGTIILNSTTNLTTKTGLMFTRDAAGDVATGTFVEKVWGNSAMTLDVNNSRVTIGDGGTVTLGVVKSSVLTSFMSGANQTTAANGTASSLFIVGALASSTFAGSVTDGIRVNQSPASNNVQAAILGLTKVGNTAFTLSNQTGSTFSGPLSILGGTLEIGNTGLGGVNNGTTSTAFLTISTAATPGTLIYSGATVGNSSISSSARALIIGSSATIQANGAAASNIINLSNTSALGFGAGATTTTLTLSGANTGTNTLAAALVDNGANSTSLVKSGTGNWILTNAGNNFTGGTTVSGGKLIAASLTGGPINVTGGTLQVSGNVAGLITTSSGSRIAPGGVNNGVAELDANGGMSIGNGTNLDIEFGVGNDQFNLNGANLTLGTGVNVTVQQAGLPDFFAGLGTYPIFTNVGNIGSITSVNTKLSVGVGDPTAIYTFGISGSSIVLTVTTTATPWTGAANPDQNWSTANNWTGNVLPGATGGVSFDGSSGQQFVNLDSDRTVGIMQLDNGSNPNFYQIYTLNNSTLHLNAGSNHSFAQLFNRAGINEIAANVALDQNSTITVSGQTLTMSGVIGDPLATNSAVTVAGPGVLLFTANNTYAGSTTIGSVSTVELGDNTGAGTIGNGTSVLVNNGLVVFNRSGAYTFSNPTSGTGTWRKDASGTVTLGAVNYTFGSFTITNGMVHVGSNNLSNTTVSGGTLQGDTGFISGTVLVNGGIFNTNSAAVSAAVTINSGTINFNNTTTFSGGLTVNGGTVDLRTNIVTLPSLSGSASSGVVTSSLVGATSLVLSMASSTNTTYSGAISGPISLNLQEVSGSGGTITLTHSSSYTGKTIIGNATDATNSGGTIVMRDSAALSSGEIDILGRANNPVLLLTNGIVLTNNIVLSNVAGSKAAIGIISIDGNNATYTGNVTTAFGAGTSSTDFNSSLLRLAGASGANGVLTLQNNYITNAQTNGGFNSAIMLTGSGVTVDNATVNATTSEIILGQGGSSTITVTNSGSIIAAGVAGVEAANIGGGVLASNDTVTLNGAGKIDIGLGNFNLNGGTTNTVVINLNGTGKLIAGGFTKSGTGSVTINMNGGSIVPTQDNATFIPTGVTIPTPVDGVTPLTLNFGAFNVGIGANVTHAGTASTDAGLVKLGTGTLTMSGTFASRYNGITQVNQGTLYIGQSAVGTNSTYSLASVGGISSNGAGTLIAGSASTLTAAGTLATANITVNGVLNANGTASAISTTNLIVNGTLNAAKQVVATAMTINAGGFANLALNGTNLSTSVVNSLTIAGSVSGPDYSSNNWTGKLDITDNTLVIETAGGPAKAAAMVTLADQIVSGRGGVNANTWTGNGIVSSRILADTTGNSTLALVDNADLGLTSYAGQTLDSNSIFITRAVLGDADLSGQVDLADFDAWFNHNGFITSSYAQADWNNDGITDLADFDIWFNHNGFVLNLLAGDTGGTGAVPEPASLTMLAIGSAALLTRRRRKQ